MLHGYLVAPPLMTTLLYETFAVPGSDRKDKTTGHTTDDSAGAGEAAAMIGRLFGKSPSRQEEC